MFPNDLVAGTGRSAIEAKELPNGMIGYYRKRPELIISVRYSSTYLETTRLSEVPPTVGLSGPFAGQLLSQDSAHVRPQSSCFLQAGQYPACAKRLCATLLCTTPSSRYVGRISDDMRRS